MNTKILVTYASTHGSTQEVAEKIAETLRGNELAVELQTLRSVRSLDGFSAVVLGAPLYMFRWHKDALRFLARFQKNLTGGLPIAIFAGGPIGKGDENEWNGVRSQLDKEMAKFPWLNPVSVEVVGGKFDPSHLGFPWSLIPALKSTPANDLRDWDAIQAWAHSLPMQFALKTSTAQA